MKALKDAKGFTLIELLVVVAIIGILAAIAIPQFAEYRKRGFDARANSDLRNAATAEEAYFATTETYTKVIASLPGFAASKTVTTVMDTDAATWFSGTSTSTSGTGKDFSYSSNAGGMQN